MEKLFDTSVEGSKMDTSHRVFESFIVAYQPILKTAEDYLEDIVERTAPAYAEAYKPWKDALHELLRGAYLISRKIPLPNKDRFVEALQMFSFDSTIKFLCDICKLCGIKLAKDWEEDFHEYINQLLFALASLNRQPQHSPAR